MKKTKKKRLLMAFAAISSSMPTFAQGDATGAINQMLENFTLPVFGGFMLAGAALGVMQQWDNIVDKENRGTRKDGFVAVGFYVGFAMLAALVITAVKSSVSGVDLSI